MKAIYGVYDGKSNHPIRTVELEAKSEKHAEEMANDINEELQHVSSNRLGLIIVVGESQTATDRFEAYELAMSSAELIRARRIKGNSFYNQAEATLEALDTEDRQ